MLGPVAVSSVAPLVWLLGPLPPWQPALRVGLDVGVEVLGEALLPLLVLLLLLLLLLKVVDSMD